MKRLSLALTLPLILTACATDPLVERCYQDVQNSDFPLAKRISVDFATSGTHDAKSRKWAIIPVKDQQSNEDWLICVYDKETDRLVSANTYGVVERQVQCDSPCGITRRIEN